MTAGLAQRLLRKVHDRETASPTRWDPGFELSVLGLGSLRHQAHVSAR